jgi:hypothetical protein
LNLPLAGGSGTPPISRRASSIALVTTFMIALFEFAMRLPPLKKDQWCVVSIQTNLYNAFSGFSGKVPSYTMIHRMG